MIVFNLMCERQKCPCNLHLKYSDAYITIKLKDSKSVVISQFHYAYNSSDLRQRWSK